MSGRGQFVARAGGAEAATQRKGSPRCSGQNLKVSVVSENAYFSTANPNAMFASDDA
jgi:hypothetical protein